MHTYQFVPYYVIGRDEFGYEIYRVKHRSYGEAMRVVNGLEEKLGPKNNFSIHHWTLIEK